MFPPTGPSLMVFGGRLSRAAYYFFALAEASPQSVESAAKVSRLIPRSDEPCSNSLRSPKHVAEEVKVQAGLELQFVKIYRS